MRRLVTAAVLMTGLAIIAGAALVDAGEALWVMEWASPSGDGIEYLADDGTWKVGSFPPLPPGGVHAESTPLGQWTATVNGRSYRFELQAIRQSRPAMSRAQPRCQPSQNARVIHGSRGVGDSCE